MVLFVRLICNQHALRVLQQIRERKRPSGKVAGALRRTRPSVGGPCLRGRKKGPLAGRVHALTCGLLGSWVLVCAALAASRSSRWPLHCMAVKSRHSIFALCLVFRLALLAGVGVSGAALWAARPLNRPEAMLSNGMSEGRLPRNARLSLPLAFACWSASGRSAGFCQGD